MHHLLNRPEQPTHERAMSLRALTPLGRMTALALLGIALTYSFLVVSIWWTSGTVVLPVLAFVIVAVIAAGSVAAGVRWAPLLGALVALVIAVITLAEPLAPSALLHPAANPVRFGGLVTVLACALTAFGAGVATAIPRAGGLQRVPYGLRSALFGLGAWSWA